MTVLLPTARKAAAAAQDSRCLAALLLIVLLVLCGCSGGQKDPYAMPEPEPATSPQAVTWNFSPGAITVILDAESDSNLVDGEPHATSLCLMQAPAMEALQALAATEEGLRELLQCKARPPEILSASQYYVQPGAYRVFPLDRQAGAQYVAVVAGFDTLTPEGCFAVVPVPIHEQKEHSYLFFSYMLYSAAPMKLSVDIGQATISARGVERDD